MRGQGFAILGVRSTSDYHDVVTLKIGSLEQPLFEQERVTMSKMIGRVPEGSSIVFFTRQNKLR
jgi:hypothetical protein